MGRIIQPEEWQGRGTVRLARWLLGKVLVRTGPEGLQAPYGGCEDRTLYRHHPPSGSNSGCFALKSDSILQSSVLVLALNR